MKEKTLELKAINPNFIKVRIEGTGELVLNKMNDYNARQLTEKQEGKSKNIEAPNEWEQIITAMHWKEPLEKIKPADYSEKKLKELLKTNAPCITGFGLKKACMDAVVRNGIDTYSTKFNSTVNIVEPLIPIRFTEHYIDKKLMSPKRGAPVLTKLNRFTGWSAEFTISYLDTNYSEEQIINILNLAGFGGGIGSGRSSGYGRFKVVSVS